MWLLAPLTTLTTLALAAPLDTTEAKIAAFVDERADAAIALLERSSNINSGTLNVAGVKQVAELFEAPLAEVGLEVRWRPLPASTKRAGHLFAQRRGKAGKPRFLLIGHLDTVFEPDSPFQRFERVKGQPGWVRGPGVYDMKGGDVVIVLALEALAHAGVLPEMSVTVALTGDEESAGRPLSLSRAPLISAAKQADVALGFEPGITQEGVLYASVARRSSTPWTLEVQGARGHSSMIFGETYGAGAINEAARIISDMYGRLRGERYLTFNAGLMLGGSEVTLEGPDRGSAKGKSNVIPAKVLVKGDLRTISQAQLERSQAAMKKIAALHLPGTKAELRFGEGYPPMSPKPENQRLLEVLSAASRDLGHGAVQPYDPGGRGAADISFVAPHVPACLAGLGPRGRGAHGTDEAIYLPSVARAAKRGALLMYRLHQGG